MSARPAAHKAKRADDGADDPMTAVFFALGDPIRLRLVRRLGRGPALSVLQLSDELPVTRQAVSKHLRVLQGAGLVTPTKRGREQLYALEAGRVDEARLYLDGISAGWDRALARLKAMVED